MSKRENRLVRNHESSGLTSKSVPAIQNATIASLLSKISDLEKDLAEQKLVNARISQLEQKLAAIQPQSLSAEPTSANAKVNSLRTSRRKFLKGMGFAAAGFAASATAFGSQPTQEAKAASGDFVLLGNSNLTSDTTYFSQSSGTPTDKAIVWGDWNSVGKSPAPTVEAGVAGTGTNIGGFFQGSNAPILLKPAESGTGAPGGSHNTGELYVDSTGELFYCKDGTTSDWVSVSSGSGTGSSGSYINLQSSTPGTQQTGNANISGAIIAGGSIEAGTKFLLSSVPLLESGTSFPSSPADGQRFRHMSYRSWFTYLTADSKWHQENPGIFSGSFPTISSGDNTAAPKIEIKRPDLSNNVFYYDGTNWNNVTGNVVILDTPARLIDDSTQRASGYSVTIQVTGVNTLDSSNLLPGRMKACFFKISLLGSSASGGAPGQITCIIANPSSSTTATSFSGYVDYAWMEVTGFAAASLNSSGEVSLTILGGGTNRFVVDVVGYVL